MTMKPLIHFSHATGMPVPVYRTLLQQLEQHYDVITSPTLGIDQRYPIDAHWQSLTQQVIDSIVTQAQGRKVIGVGHSLGAALTFLASYQRPELFEQNVLLDPPLILGMASLQLHYAKYFNRVMLDKITPAHLSIKRREHWQSREQAGEMLRPKGFYKDFDERCFQDYLKYALRDDTV
ncbi:MAG: alpha/beta hydrolase, partial [Acinetobacter sp.]|nr:alpha/beta hydrolase [Acinetobacter sp.]